MRRRNHERQTPGPLRGAVHLRLVPYRHTALLIAIVAVFFVRPVVGESKAGLILYSVSAVALLLLALYNIDVDSLMGERTVLIAQRRRRIILAWVLIVPAIAERVLLLFTSSRSIFLAGSVIWFLLLAFITWNELRAVLRQKEITREVISMAISTYLLLGFTWGLFYAVLHALQPNAISLGGTATLDPRKWGIDGNLGDRLSASWFALSEDVDRVARR